MWFRYQADSLSNPTACSGQNREDYSPPVRISAGDLGLLLFDSSCAGEEPGSMACNKGQEATIYPSRFATVNNLANQAGGDNVLLTHTPIWTINGVQGGSPTWISQTLADATNHTLDPNIKTVLSGHVHLYEMLDFGSNPPMGQHRPPQVTVGSSGTTLDNQTWTDSQIIGQQQVDNVIVNNLITRRLFGYAVLQDSGGTWNLRYHDQSGGQVTGTNCTLNNQGTAFTNCM